MDNDAELAWDMSHTVGPISSKILLSKQITHEEISYFLKEGEVELYI